MTGDASTLDPNKFLEWYNMSTDAIGNYDMDLMASRANIRFQQSKAENPYFYYGPFTGMIARNAGIYSLEECSRTTLLRIPMGS
jgi:hypothetical protein